MTDPTDGTQDQPAGTGTGTGASGDDGEPLLAGAGGDDLSAGTSVSGLGGELLKTADPTAGLEPVEERAAEVGWGRDVAETGMQPPAGNDGTGQSEKPSR